MSVCTSRKVFEYKSRKMKFTNKNTNLSFGFGYVVGGYLYIQALYTKLRSHQVISFLSKPGASSRPWGTSCQVPS